MRITVLDNDPGRNIWHTDEHYQVLLNGDELQNVYTADDEKGEVVVAELDDDGCLVTENGEIKMHTLRGTVRIIRQRYSGKY